MTWLVKQKVLPPLIIGEPPNYSTILDAQKHDPVVGWRLKFNDRELGWALSQVKRQDNNMMEISSRVHFAELPLAELTSVLSRVFNSLIESSVPKLSLDAESSLLIDPLGKLSRFDTLIHTNAFSDPIRLQGVVNGSQMVVSIDFRDFSNKKELYLPQNALIGDALSPQTQLPNLCEGQTWTVPSFSPFRSAGNTMEIQVAKVEGREMITWENQILETWLVVYRNDPGRGFSSASDIPRDKVWVSDDGRVLKQQVTIFDSSMTFFRMSDTEARKLAADAAQEDSYDLDVELTQ
jgi:hypothetical protein